MGLTPSRLEISRRSWLAAALSAAACGCSSRPALRIWAHQGQEAEHAALAGIVEAFNRHHAAGSLRAELTFFPDFQYPEKLAIAAAAGDLPAAFELDGPLVARFASAGLLAPLAGLFSAAERRDFLPTIIEQGTFEGQLYSVGAFESATVLYGDREMLAGAGVAVPAAGQAFTWAELMLACERLKRSGVRPMSLHMNENADEWFTYAFSPLLWSGGGALIGNDGSSVRGELASARNVASLRAWQALFELGYASADPVDPDPFGGGKTALDWSGHWMMRSHVAKKGARLLVMPLPGVGPAPVAGCGTYCWGIARPGHQQAAAGAWLRWVTDPEHGVTPLARASGAIPGRRSAFSRFPEYDVMPYAWLKEQLETIARPRPRTVFYSTLTQRFAAALRDIARGDDVAERLRRAEDEIARVIERRSGRRG